MIGRVLSTPENMTTVVMKVKSCVAPAFGMMLWLVSMLMPWHHAFAEESDNSPAQTDVIWARTDFPPFFIVRGDYGNQGISDNLIKTFSARISGYRHSTAEMTLGRMLDNAKKGIPTCHVALLKTPEREQFIDYSEPVMISYANGIITSADGLKRLGMDQDQVQYVDLGSLIGKKISISVHQGRSYSPVIDAAIVSQRDNPDSIFQFKAGHQEQERLIKQVLANRLDGFIARPEEVYFRKFSSNEPSPLYLVGIEGQALVSKGYVGCTKGDWNDRLLEQLNHLITLPDVREDIHRDHMKWLPDNLARHYHRYEAEVLGLTHE